MQEGAQLLITDNPMIGLNDIGENLLADVRKLRRLAATVGNFPDRNDRFRLCANVNQRFVVIDPNDDTFNHIAAVTVPIAFGALGMIDPSIIFWLGCGIASVSLTCSFLVPRHPAPGLETVLVAPRPQPSE